MNMCVSPPRKAAKKDVAYIIVRSDGTPVAIFENQDDAQDMEGSYNQEMKDRDIPHITFKVIATAFYPE